MVKKTLLYFIISLLLSFTHAVHADVISFDFKDPKKVNTISILLDSTFEPIMGFANGISGNVTFDPVDKTAASGNILVKAKSIRLANKTMTKVLHSKDWLNVKKYPNIEFVFREIVSTESMTDTQFNLTVSGDFSLKGITREIKVPVVLTYHPGKLKDRNHKGNGDLLVLRTQFKIDRNDYGIKPDMDTNIVAKDIQLTVSIVGYTKK